MTRENRFSIGRPEGHGDLRARPEAFQLARPLVADGVAFQNRKRPYDAIASTNPRSDTSGLYAQSSNARAKGLGGNVNKQRHETITCVE